MLIDKQPHHNEKTGEVCFHFHQRIIGFVIRHTQITKIPKPKIKFA